MKRNEYVTDTVELLEMRNALIDLIEQGQFRICLTNKMRTSRFLDDIKVFVRDDCVILESDCEFK